MANDEKDFGKIVYGFIAIIVGVVLLSITADSIFSNTTLTPIVGENITVAGANGTAKTVQLANSDVMILDRVGNNQINTTMTTININQQVNFTRAGVLTLGVNFTNSTYLVNYQYQGNEYVDDTESRTIVNIIPIFFALAVLLTGIVLFAKGSGFV